MARSAAFVTFTPLSLVFVGLCAAGMLALAYLSVGDLLSDLPFLHAEVVRGTVLARDDQTGIVTYEFTTAEGQTIQARDVVNIDTRKTLEVSGPVDVEYLPGPPVRSRVGEPWQWVWPVAIVLLTLGAALVFGGMFIESLRQVLRERRLGRDGQLAEATVIAVARGMYPDSTAGWRQIRYRFVDRFGVRHEGKTPQFPEAEAAPEVGDLGSVRYAPDNPTESVWVGLEPGQRERRLARGEVVIDRGEGVCRGTVLAATRPTAVNVWTIRYRFRDQAGRMHEGEDVVAPNRDGSSAYAPGSAIEVYFDPSNPEDSGLA